MAKKTAKTKTSRGKKAAKKKPSAKKAQKQTSTAKKKATKSGSPSAKKKVTKKTVKKAVKKTAEKAAKKAPKGLKSAAAVKKASAASRATTSRVAKKAAKPPAKKVPSVVPRRTPLATAAAKKKVPARKAAAAAATSEVVEPPPPPKVAPLSKRLSKTNLQTIREALLQRRAQLLGSLGGLEVDTLRAEQHSVQAGGDEIDHATYSVAADLSLRMAESESRELREIVLALTKLEDGSYGICEATGLPIDVRRLLFMPAARLSLEAQQQLEKEQLYHDVEHGWVRSDT